MRSTLLNIVCFGALTGLVALTGCPKDNSGGSGSGSDGGSSTVAGQGGTSSGGGGKAGGGSGGTATNDGGASGSSAGAGGTTAASDAGAGPGSSDDAAVGGGEAACTTPCAAYQHCELAQCVDNASCGGFAARPCSGMASCQDDPRDSCDPKNGGADCGGLCVCAGGVFCVQGKVFDKSACMCVDAANSGGVACGKNTCKNGDYCCNASCGTCAPKGAACTQQACL